jgi:hypothetical protein
MARIASGVKPDTETPKIPINLTLAKQMVCTRERTGEEYAF